MGINTKNYSQTKTAVMNNASGVPIRSLSDQGNHMQTAGKMLFGHRQNINDPVVMQGTYDGIEISITNSQLQGIVSLLHDELNEMGIHKGTSIMLVSFPASSEILKNIYFITLVTMGAKVFMPRKNSVQDLGDWISTTHLQYALIPGKELLSHEQHEEDNAMLLEMNDIFISRHVSLLDTISSFPLDRLIRSGDYRSLTGNGGQCQAYLKVLPVDEALVLTFPGTNGKVAFKTYTQQQITEESSSLKLPTSILAHPMAGGGS